MPVDTSAPRAAPLVDRYAMGAAILAYAVSDLTPDQAQAPGASPNSSPTSRTPTSSTPTA
jgi:hypothetical protein